MASRLTGWHLNVMTEAQVREKSEAEKDAARKLFVDRLEVDAEIADILVQEGFSTIEEIAYVPEAELLAVEEFDADIVAELRNRARDALLTQMIADEEEIEAHRPADDLIELEGMEESVAYALAARGIVSREDLAEAAVDEIADIEGLDAESAGALIMSARAHWFEETEG